MAVEKHSTLLPLDTDTERTLLVKILTVLNNQSGGGSGTASTYKTGAGSPVGFVTPAFVGQLYVDTSGGLWESNGLTNNSWTQLI